MRRIVATHRSIVVFVCLCVFSLHAGANDDTTSRWIELRAHLGVYGARYSNQATELGAHDLVGSAPRDGLRLNIISGSVRGRFDAVYGALTLQTGDYARASWMNDMYWLQEAFIGVHLTDAMRLEGGSFSSHVGIESMILTENHSGIISLPGFFDPNYFGGVKYLWNVSGTVEMQFDVVTSFNGYVLEEGMPSLTTGVTWQRDSTHMIAGNVFVSRETIDEIDQTQLYFNLQSSLELPDVHFLGEVNYALELADASISTTSMVSGFIAGYVDVVPTVTIGLRGEFVIDPDGILADDRFNAPLPYRTLSAGGFTGTLSYKPLPWCMVRADMRYLTTFDDRSFIETDPYVHERTEAVLSVDFTL